MLVPGSMPKIILSVFFVSINFSLFFVKSLAKENKFFVFLF